MKHVVFLSFGKDSMAQLLEMLRLGMQVDDVVYVDIRYTKELSGEHPKMAEWLPYAEKILLNRFGVKVTHITADAPFKEHFYRAKAKGNHVGDLYGFPYIVGAWCNSRLKIDVIKRYINQQQEEVCEYVGIAYDEPIRYERLKQKETAKVKYRSILYELGITEQRAFEICKQNNLLSPMYDGGGYRGGCWFCVKQCYADIYDLWKNYPDYFNELKTIERDSRNSFKPSCRLAEIETRFLEGYTPKRKKKQEGGGDARQ